MINNPLRGVIEVCNLLTNFQSKTRGETVTLTKALVYQRHKRDWPLTSNVATTNDASGAPSSAEREAISLVSGRAIPRSKKMAAGWANTRCHPRTRAIWKLLSPGQVPRACSEWVGSVSTVE